MHALDAPASKPVSHISDSRSICAPEVMETEEEGEGKRSEEEEGEGGRGDRDKTGEGG